MLPEPSRLAAPSALALAALALLLGSAPAWAQQGRGPATSAAPGTAAATVRELQLAPQEAASEEELIRQQYRPWNLQLGLDATVTATSNSAYTSNMDGSSDTLLVLSPWVRVTGMGPRLRLNGEFQLDAVKYTRETQSDRVLPQGALNGNLMVVENWLGVDGALMAQQTRSDPFFAQGEGPSTSGKYTTTHARLSPYLERELNADWTALARTEVSRTRFDADDDALADRASAHGLHHQVRLSRRPTPFGGLVEAHYEKSGYVGEPTSELTQKRGRALLSYALHRQLVISGIGGREATRTAFTDRTDSFGGGQVDWQPNVRTHLLATLEHHFFGPAWELSLSHRGPTYAGLLSMQRELTTSANSLGILPFGASLKGLLGSIMTTRYPNEVERDGVVQDMLRERGLSGSEGLSQDLYALAVQVRQALSARMALMGPRDTMVLFLDVIKYTPEAWANDPLVSLSIDANLQRIAELQYSHRMTRLTSLDAALRWARTTTPGSDRSTTETSLRAGINSRLSPQTTATLGLRHQLLNVNTSSEDPKETALYLGLGHRF